MCFIVEILCAPNCEFAWELLLAFVMEGAESYSSRECQYLIVWCWPPLYSQVSSDILGTSLLLQIQCPHSLFQVGDKEPCCVYVSLDISQQLVEKHEHSQLFLWFTKAITQAVATGPLPTPCTHYLWARASVKVALPSAEVLSACAIGHCAIKLVCLLLIEDSSKMLIL